MDGSVQWALGAIRSSLTGKPALQTEVTLNFRQNPLMLPSRFRASVQYDDLIGTSAADRADKGSPEEFLRGKGLMTSGEFVVGIELWAGEARGGHRGPVAVHFLLTNGTFDSAEQAIDQSTGPIPVRRVTVDMSVADLLGLFKRFSLCLSPGGMLNNRQYSYEGE